MLTQYLKKKILQDLIHCLSISFSHFLQLYILGFSPSRLAEKEVTVFEFVDHCSSVPFVCLPPSSVLMTTLEKKKSLRFGAGPEVHRADFCQVFCLTNIFLFNIISSF